MIKIINYRINKFKDDAKSSSIQIIFETKNNVVTRILFKNNGIYFRPEDWNRLKKIAEGNPDEQKVSLRNWLVAASIDYCDLVLTGIVRTTKKKANQLTYL